MMHIIDNIFIFYSLFIIMSMCVCVYKKRYLLISARLRLQNQSQNQSHPRRYHHREQYQNHPNIILITKKKKSRYIYKILTTVAATRAPSKISKISLNLGLQIMMGVIFLRSTMLILYIRPKKYPLFSLFYIPYVGSAPAANNKSTIAAPISWSLLAYCTAKCKGVSP